MLRPRYKKTYIVVIILADYFYSLFFIQVVYGAILGSIRVKNEVLFHNGVPLKVIIKKDSVIQKEPLSSSPVKQTVNPFQIFYILNPEQTTGSNPQIKKNGFYRIGETTNKNNVLGWINEKDVKIWSRREAIKFAPITGRKPARIYKTKDDLTETKEAISQENFDTSKKGYKILLPVLNIKKEKIQGTTAWLYNVAYLHSPNIEILPDKTDEALIKKHGQLDIMFVIDTTAGMGPFISATKEAVKFLAVKLKEKQIKRSMGLSVQWGLIAYRDRLIDLPQLLMGYVYKTYSKLTNDISRFQQKLNEINESPLESNDTPEAMFDGLNAAISGGQGWREHGVKLILDRSPSFLVYIFSGNT